LKTFLGLVVAGGVGALIMIEGAVAGPIETLPGRWTGWGHMTLDSGNTERVKCIATYIKENDGRELRHNLRCASSNYRIDAIAQLKVSRGQVNGEWQERTYSTGARSQVVSEAMGSTCASEHRGQTQEVLAGWTGRAWMAVRA
jgi:hypothetical protein